MLTVDLHNIFSEDELAGALGETLRRVDEEHQIVVVTRSGHPSVAMVSVQQLEELSGHSVHTPVMTPTPEPSAAPVVPATKDLPPLAEVRPVTPAVSMPVSGFASPDFGDSSAVLSTVTPAATPATDPGIPAGPGPSPSALSDSPFSDTIDDTAVQPVHDLPKPAFSSPFSAFPKGSQPVPSPVPPIAPATPAAPTPPAFPSPVSPVSPIPAMPPLSQPTRPSLDLQQPTAPELSTLNIDSSPLPDMPDDPLNSSPLA